MKQEIQTYLEKVAALESSLMNLRASCEALKFHEECYQTLGIEPNYSLAINDAQIAEAINKPSIHYSTKWLPEEEIAETCKKNYPNYFALQTEETKDMWEFFNDITEPDYNARDDIFFKHYKAPYVAKPKNLEVVYKPEEVAKVEHFHPMKIVLIAVLASLGFALFANLLYGGDDYLLLFMIMCVPLLAILLPLGKVSNQNADKYDAYMEQLRKYENYIRDKESSEARYISLARTAVEAAFHQAMEKATTEYTEFAQNRNQGIASEISKLESLIQEGEETLLKLYDKNILHPKYRNMTAVCTILEYFETGRCSSLTGSDGAYNLYESEIRQNLIILKLDEVIEHLDELKATMYRCCTAIERVSKQLNGIQQELKQLNATASKQLLVQQEQVKFASLTTAYTAATAANTEAIKYLSLVN